MMLHDFHRYLLRRNYSPGTIDKRTATVRRYLADVPEWREATFRDVERHVDSLHVAPTTRRDVVSHVRAFYRWAMREGLCHQDPTALVETVRLPARLPRPAPEPVVAEAVRAATGQLRVMLVLMAAVGLRCCEVAALTWERVDLAAGRIVVVGKGRRERVIVLPAAVVAELAALDGTAGPVFTSPHGGGYTAARVSQLVNGHLRACGTSTTAHQLRHRAATVALELGGGDLLVVRDMLGHSSVATTEVYARLAAGRAAATTGRMTVPGL